MTIQLIDKDISIITKLSRIYPLGTMNVCSKCHYKTMNSCSNISIGTKVVDYSEIHLNIIFLIKQYS